MPISVFSYCLLYISELCTLLVKSIPRTSDVQKPWASLKCGLITEILGFSSTHPTFYQRPRQKTPFPTPSLALLGFQENSAGIWIEMLQTTSSTGGNSRNMKGSPQNGVHVHRKTTGHLVFSW